MGQQLQQHHCWLRRPMVLRPISIQRYNAQSDSLDASLPVGATKISVAAAAGTCFEISDIQSRGTLRRLTATV